MSKLYFFLLVLLTVTAINKFSGKKDSSKQPRNACGSF